MNSRNPITLPTPGSRAWCVGRPAGRFVGDGRRCGTPTRLPGCGPRRSKGLRAFALAGEVEGVALLHLNRAGFRRPRSRCLPLTARGRALRTARGSRPLSGPRTPADHPTPASDSDALSSGMHFSHRALSPLRDGAAAELLLSRVPWPAAPAHGVLRHRPAGAPRWRGPRHPAHGRHQPGAAQTPRRDLQAPAGQVLHRLGQAARR